MSTYLEDAVEIIPPLVELIRLVRNKNSLTQTSNILKLGRTKLCAILRKDKGHKTVQEHVFSNAVQYLTRENDFSLDELCNHLDIKENVKSPEEFEKLFIPVRVSDRPKIIETIKDYIRKKEISQEEFLRELKAHNNPYFKKISGTTLKKFLHGDGQGADIKLLKTLNKFLIEKKIDQFKEKKLSYQEVIKLANQYIRTIKIDKTKFGRRVAAYNLSIGNPNTIRGWLSGKHKPSPLNKIRIIEKYIERETEFTPAKYVRGLYYICLNNQLKPDFEFPSGETCHSTYLNQLEEKIVESYNGQKYRELPREILLNLLADCLCPTIQDFQERFPQLSSYLSKKSEFLKEVFEKTLFAMPPNDVFHIADNLGITIDYGIWENVEQRDRFKKGLKSKVSSQERQNFRRAYERADQIVSQYQNKIIGEIMGKIS